MQSASHAMVSLNRTKEKWDSNGQAIWTLSHFIEHTGDLELLKKVYPAIRRERNGLSKNADRARAD